MARRAVINSFLGEPDGSGGREPQTGPLMQARGLTKSFGEGGAEQTVVDSVDLDLYPGEMVALLGASGSGKSTLLNILGLLLAPDAGTLTIAGAEVTGLSTRRTSAARLEHVSHIFQAFHLIEHKTVSENVELPLIHAGVPAAERAMAVAEALEELGLSERAAAYPATLSGGEKQRVAIARALITRPDVLLCDEPTGSLDSARSAEVIQLLRQVTRADSVTVIVTHDLGVAEQCDRVLRILDGRISEEVPGERVSGPQTAAAPEEAQPGRPAKAKVHWGWIAWAQAWNAFTGRLRRNVFTLLGVALGVSALVLSVGFAATVSAQLSDAFDAYLADRITVVDQRKEEMTEKEALAWSQDPGLQRTRSIDGVLGAAVVQRTADTVDFTLAHRVGQVNDTVSVSATTPEGLTLLEVHPAAGRLFDSGHLDRHDRVALVSEKVFTRWNRSWTPGMDVSIGDTRWSVIGVVKDFGDSRGAFTDVYIPLGVDVWPGGGPRPAKTAVQVQVKPGAADAVALQLPAAVNPFMPETIGAGVPPEPKTLRGVIDAQQQILMLGMSLLTLFIAGIGIMNTFVVAVMERRREIGIRMALGAPPRAIGAQFCWEAVFTAIGGSVIGVVVSVNILFGVAAVNGWTPVLSPLTVVIGLAAGLVVGSAAGILPAVRAARVQPVESLQQV